MRIYYTLIIWDDDNDVWYPDFGDYSETAVHEEGESRTEELNYHNSAWRVIATDDKQESINKAINEMNSRIKGLSQGVEIAFCQKKGVE